MKKKIADFIRDNKIATLCCSEKDTPYCFHCFYAFDEERHIIFFKSSAETLHSRILRNNPSISGSILPEKVELLALKGIQFSGTILREVPSGLNPSSIYHKRFPVALAKPGEVWAIQLSKVKMTDNSHIFGQKLEWTGEPV